MLGLALKALSLFRMLDYFSQLYLAGLILVVIWGVVAFFRIMVGVRAIKRVPNPNDSSSFLALERAGRKLQSFFSLAVVLATGCFANQIFGIWETYELRVTDANPLFALREAHAVSQLLICLLIIFDTLRWNALTSLDRFASPKNR